MTPIKERKAPNPDGQWIDKFLKALAENGNVSEACRRANVSKNTVYEWRNKDRAFAERWQQALEDGIESLELAAWQRAKTTSDTLAIFLLKSLKPTVYREKIELGLSPDIVALIPQLQSAAKELGIPLADVLEATIAEMTKARESGND